MRDQDRLAGSSCGLADDDMLGKEPKPSSAKPYLQLPCVALAAHGRACVQFQSRAILRMLRSSAERLGSVCKSAGSAYREVVSLWSWLDKSLPSEAASRGILESISRYSLGGTRQSKSTYCAGQDRSGNASRIGGSCDPVRLSRHHVSFGMQPCSVLSSTCDANERAAFQSRIERRFEAVYSVPFLSEDFS